jgi:hypothetical protein
VVRRAIVALACFFLFGTTMCMLTIVTLAFPGSFLEPAWRVNPEARQAFQSMGALAFVLMVIVGTACLGAAIGLFRRADWGRVLAIGVLAVNLIGDLGGAIVRRDPRTLIGLPIAGALIVFLASEPVRRFFNRKTVVLP